LALVTIGISGCVRESTEGTTTYVSYEWWVPATTFLAGVAMAPIGWALRKSIERLAWVLLIAAPIAALGFAPSLFMERSVVDDKSFSVTTGIWGMTSHKVNFDDINSVRVTSEVTRGRRGRKQTNYYVQCDKKSGGTEKIGINNQVTQKAAVPFLAKVMERNIPVNDMTGGE